MVQDRIERETVVAAPRERVWAILTQPEHVGKWFSDAAEVDLRPGGTIVVRWDSYGTMYGIVEKVDEPNVFSYRWNPFVMGEKPTPEETTLVEFTLTPQGEHTHVRVVESGFARLTRSDDEQAEQFKKNDNGWATQLRDLGQYLGELSAPTGGR